MKNTSLAITLILSASLHAQYYYDDIIGTREINSKMRIYLAVKVQSVTATGYDAEGKKAPDFTEWQDIQSNGSVLKISTRNGQSIARTYYQFDDKKRVINARDSSGDFQTITAYTYDANDNVINMKTTTRDALHDFDQVKERQYEYKEGKPVKMLLIQNSSDSLEYIFTLDEHNNIKDEMLYHRGGSQNKIYYSYDEHKVYYFYDEQNRLTDVTRYSPKIDRLLPDFMLSYDDSNRVIQRITVLSNVNYDTKRPDYLTWRYGFDEKGLKTAEVMYSKTKELKGRIKYSYTFAQ
jgi:YD repeat-containing protein